MYKEIENKYKKQTYDYKFDFWYFICSLIILLFIYSLSFFIEINWNNATDITIIILLIFTTIYETRTYNVYIKEKNKLRSNRLKYGYFDYQRRYKLYYLIFLLKNKGITSKEDIKLLIEYYRIKIPRNYKQGFFSIVSQILLGLLSFVVIFIGDDKLVDTTKMNTAIAFLVPYLSVAIICFFIKWLIKMLHKKEKTYINLEEKLSTIYVNYKKYEKILKSKIYSKEELYRNIFIKENNDE